MEDDPIEREAAWHSLSVEATFEKLDVSASGLTKSEADERLLKYGGNSLPATRKRSAIVRFLLHFDNVLIYVLLGAAVITAGLNHWVDSGVILAVVVINAIIGFIQEGKAEKVMDSIRHMLAPVANVIRDGERLSVNGEDLVPGDIVFLHAGDKVPADIRLISAHGMQVQEAILTGESVPVEKHTRAVVEDAPLGDRSSMVFSGTLVTSGQCKGVVVETGGRTEIGRISRLVSKVETLTTPLVAQMGGFAKWLTLLILVIAAVLLVYGYYVTHFDFTEIFMVVVGLSVAAIPEGLPAVLTITLAVGVQAMARRNAIVRRLPAIETLGSVSVICTDKTGTLTRNEMMVASVLTSRHLFSLEGDGYEPEGALTLDDENVYPSEHTVLEELGRAAVLCNDAALRKKEGMWVVEGDPMEGALLAFAGKVDIDVRKEREQWTRKDMIPFDAKHHFMATLDCDLQGSACVFVKGGPERILSMCRSQYGLDGVEEPLDVEYWQTKAEGIASEGQRVLALATRKVGTEHKVLDHSDVEDSLTLVGMVGLIDPPRSEAISAIADCYLAGIRVKMITGDHAKTAMAIGKQIGLTNYEKVLTGKDLDNMSDGNLRREVLDCDIFARTTPEHKLRLVMALQSHGMTVAMTGDGVNDAPALKRADAGIAMGRKGSEAAKEAAEFVLVDDNFASIVAAVREGRTVYDNIKKVISWTLPTNAGEASTITLALLLGLTLPITPIQILWVNLITASTLGIALAFEPTEENTMLRPPRLSSTPLLSGELAWHIVLVSILFLCGVFGMFSYAIDRGYSIELARTLSVNTLVVMEIFHLFFIRNIYGSSLTWKLIKGTKVVWATVIVITVAQFAITYVPVLQDVFGTESVPFWDGVLVVGVGIVLFTIIEIEKQIHLKVRGRKDA